MSGVPILRVRNQDGQMVPVPAIIGPAGPQGERGARGETGKGLQILGYFADAVELI